ncbi:MarP family serine protease [Microbacterium pygmaeum]|uniref:Colicin V production protein n=1 Tax=Microbacterium pygmaeum TaxID=370764 RepID=A0A1G7ZC30_9MICO|nr:MarP family serine protease [Microbacterium pygmaeum]SDH06137.1 Colicin V production protein [Microbacterium pygmaeum]
MIVVEIVLIGILLIALIAGVRRGFVASLGSIVGLVLGGIAAFWLVPVVNDLWPWQSTRVVAVIILTIVLLVGGGFGGAAAGVALRSGVDRTPLRVFDRILGGALAVVAGALSLTLVSSALVSTGTPVLSTALASSQVLRAIEGITPRPVAETLARVRSAVLDDGLPRLGELLALDQGGPTAPPVSLDDPVLAQAAASVARVSGTAWACGVSQTGTGFVLTADRVVTNAHVVAGVDTPIVELPGQPAREGRIVYFNTTNDLAVIAVDDLQVAPLAVVSPIAVGTAAVIQGYPYGGPFTMVNAAVISTGSPPVPDIYEESTTPREIYGLAADVQPGNSGGPLLTAEGAVAGVVFARADADEQRGYAMTTTELEPVLLAAPGLSDPVGTGRCTS